MDNETVWVGLSRDEVPVIFMDAGLHPDTTVPVDRDTFNRWRSVCATYTIVQRQMEEAFKATR